MADVSSDRSVKRCKGAELVSPGEVLQMDCGSGFEGRSARSQRHPGPSLPSQRPVRGLLGDATGRVTSTFMSHTRIRTGRPDWPPAYQTRRLETCTVRWRRALEITPKFAAPRLSAGMSKNGVLAAL